MDWPSPPRRGGGAAGAADPLGAALLKEHTAISALEASSRALDAQLQRLRAAAASSAAPPPPPPPLHVPHAPVVAPPRRQHASSAPRPLARARPAVTELRLRVHSAAMAAAPPPPRPQPAPPASSRRAAAQPAAAPAPAPTEGCTSERCVGERRRLAEQLELAQVAVRRLTDASAAAAAVSPPPAPAPTAATPAATPAAAPSASLVAALAAAERGLRDSTAAATTARAREAAAVREAADAAAALVAARQASSARVAALEAALALAQAERDAAMGRAATAEARLAAAAAPATVVVAEALLAQRDALDAAHAAGPPSLSLSLNLDLPPWSPEAPSRPRAPPHASTLSSSLGACDLADCGGSVAGGGAAASVSRSCTDSAPRAGGPRRAAALADAVCEASHRRMCAALRTLLLAAPSQAARQAEARAAVEAWRHRRLVLALVAPGGSGAAGVCGSQLRWTLAGVYALPSTRTAPLGAGDENCDASGYGAAAVAQRVWGDGPAVLRARSLQGALKFDTAARVFRALSGGCGGRGAAAVVPLAADAVVVQRGGGGGADNSSYLTTAVV